MHTDAPTKAVSAKMVWAGRIMSTLAVLMLLTSGAMKLAKPDAVVETFTKLGYDPKLTIAIGVVELVCTLVYVFPQTAVLGAVLLTGYLGGATATHVRVEDPAISVAAPVFFGVLVWLGLFLRDPRLRALLPLRA